MPNGQFSLVDEPTICDLKQKKKEEGPGSLQNWHVRGRIQSAKYVEKEPSKRWRENQKNVETKEDHGRERIVSCVDC